MLNLTLFFNQCVISDSCNSEVLYSVVLKFCWSLTFLTVRHYCFVDLAANLYDFSNVGLLKIKLKLFFSVSF